MATKWWWCCWLSDGELGGPWVWVEDKEEFEEDEGDDDKEVVVVAVTESGGGGKGIFGGLLTKGLRTWWEFAGPVSAWFSAWEIVWWWWWWWEFDAEFVGAEVLLELLLEDGLYVCFSVIKTLLKTWGTQVRWLSPDVAVVCEEEHHSRTYTQTHKQ